MKKSLIALAVLAASGAAMAQSSVTLYGIADVWFGYESTDTLTSPTTKTETSDTLLKAGGVNTSRWGVKGSEDLGGGLKANFDFQQGFNLDTGAASSSSLAFARQSWVGLSGGFGATRIGRTTTPYDDVNGASNTMFDSYFSPFNRIASSTSYVARPDNTLYYQAPNMSGFSGALSYSLAESSTTDDSYSANLTYAGGPFKVQFGYQFEGESSTLKEKQFTRLGASYDFGGFTFKGTWGQVENAAGISGRDADEWQLGLDYKTGPWVFTGSYAQSNKDSYFVGANFVNEEDRMGFGLGAAYTFSKRTFVYAAYEQDTTEVSGSSNYPNLDHSAFGIGINHKF